VIDKSFYDKHQNEIDVDKLSSLLKDHVVKIVGNGKTLSNITTLDNATSSDISFLHNAKYLSALTQSKAGVILIDQDLYKDAEASDQTFMICRDVYGACSLVLNYFYGYREQEMFLTRASANIHPGAVIDKTAIIGSNCFIGKATIGANTKLSPNTVVADGVVIGDNVVIGSNCSISYARIGDNSTIASGVQIGSEGFGYTTSAKGHSRIKHFGRVILHKNVSIGDNAVIHKGSLRDTIIGEGTKVDSLVHIAHNVEIGKHCFIAAQTGFAGSSIVKDFVAFGGQCGVAGHITIGSNVRFAAQAGVTKNISDHSGDYYGMPAVPKRVWQKTQIMLRKIVKNNKNL
jgi:UDP-3-O-[3-hydroxymyristoyl] glucosamine N-acyltransferase